MALVRDLVRIEHVVDLTSEAAAEGFLVTVGVSRRAYESVVRVTMPCPCASCEENAAGATKDRVRRMFRALRDALVERHGAADEAPPRVEFALDIQVQPDGERRRMVPLCADITQGDGGPVITILEGDERPPGPLAAGAAPAGGAR